MKMIPRFLVLLSFGAAIAAAQTLTHQWAFGEDAPGAADFDLVAGADDRVGNMTLTPGGTVRYLADTPGTASSLSAAFYGSSANFTGNADTALGPASSFIIEGWFTFDGTPSATTNILFYNGNPSSSGIGLYVTGNTLQLLAGGRADVTVGTVNINQWNYVALVYANGTASTYVNSGTTPSYAGSRSFGEYSGADPFEKFYVGGGFDGAVDELRISSFTGSFNTSMLSYAAISAVPEPSTYAALAGFAALGLVVWRRRAVRV